MHDDTCREFFPLERARRIEMMHATIARCSLGDTAVLATQTRDRETRVEPLLQGACDIEILKDLAGFEKLEHDWNELYSRAARSHQVFQSFNLLWHWTRHLFDPRRQRLAIVTGRVAGRLVVVLPMLLERRLGLRTLTWMGAPVCQYGDVLVDNDPCAGYWLAQTWDGAMSRLRPHVVLLQGVREDAAIAALPALKNARCIRHEQAVSLGLTGQGGYPAFEAGRTSKIRKNRKRQARRLAEIGAIEVETLSGGDRACQLARQALAMKRDWLAGRGLYSRAFATDGFDDFFCNLAAAGSHPAGCLVSALSVAGKPSAIAIGIEANGRLALHIIAHDLTLDACAPGALHLEELLRASFDKGLEQFDMMWPAQPYKSEWTQQSVGVRELVVTRSVTARGAFALMESLRSAGRALSPRLPAPVQAVISRRIAGRAQAID